MRACSASPSEATFRRICLSLIALAVVIGLPLLDGILR